MAQGKTGYVEFSASSFGGTQILRVNWSETYNQAANTSDVTITSLELKSSTWVGQAYYGNLIVKINGVAAITLDEQNNSAFLNNFDEFATVYGSGSAVITGTVSNIAHNADGSKTVGISLAANGYPNPLFWSSDPGTINFTAGSQNIALTTIPRQYTLSISAGAGTTVTVKRGGTTLSNGSPITYGDVLTISAAASAGYALSSLKVNGSSFVSGNTHTVSGNVSVVSAATAMASRLSAPSSGTIGTALTLTVTRYNSNYTHTITCEFAGTTRTVVSKGSATTISWTPPLAMLNAIPNSTQANATFKITTYSGDTAIGTNTDLCTLVAPLSIEPSPTITVTDAMGYLATYGGYVQSKSKAAVVIADGLQYSATLANRIANANGATYNAASFTTTPLQQSGSNAISVTVTDSRGKTGSSTSSITVLPYGIPAITEFGVHRCQSDGTPDDNGEYFYANWGVEISPLNSRNSKTLKISYRPSGGAWTEVNIPLTAYTETGITAAFAVSTDYSYDVQLAVTDDFATTTQATRLSTTPSTISFLVGGNGVAFGKAAELNYRLDTMFPIRARSFIDFGDASNGLRWETDDGTLWHIRPDTGGNIFQIVYSKDSGSTWSSVFSITTSGNPFFGTGKALPVANGGTGSTSAADARTALGIATVNAENLTANWLNMTAARNNAGMKFIRSASGPNANMAAGTERVVGTLSADYRPSYNINHFCQVNDSGTVCLLKITTAGAVTITPYSAISTSQPIHINLAYI